MKVKAIKTRRMNPPQDDLFEVITESVGKIEEESVLVVTSKVVAIHQGRVVDKGSVASKDELGKMEADFYLDRDQVPGGHILFTIKNNILVSSGGIDESNGGEYYVLWPENPAEFCKQVRGWLVEKYQVKNLGVIVVDSHILPMRRGTFGVAIAHFGFNPVRNYVGSEDLFGRKYKVSVLNIVDSLATAAVLVMGEGSESRPLAIVSEIPWLEFSDDETLNKGNPTLVVGKDEDLFGPMINAATWKRGGKK